MIFKSVKEARSFQKVKGTQETLNTNPGHHHLDPPHSIWSSATELAVQLWVANASMNEESPILAALCVHQGKSAHPRRITRLGGENGQ